MSSGILSKWVMKLLSSGSRHSRRASSEAANRRPAMKMKPRVEILEDRITPSNWNVTDASDSAGDANSLRYAVNHAANGDTITFAASLGTITVATPLTIAANVTITGPGAASQAISGGGTSSQVFVVNASVTASISGLTITAGAANGILNNGMLTLGSDSISGNTGSDINNAVGANLYAGDTGAFTSSTNVINNGTLNLAGNNESIGALTGSGTITNSLHTYQIDNGGVGLNFNDTLFSTEPADDWVGNVFTSASGGTQLQSVSFYDSASNLNSGDLPNPNIWVALYTGAPGANLTLVPGSVNEMALNTGTGWITVPFASPQNIPAGQQFTAALLIKDVPGNVFPFSEDTSSSNANSYFDVNSPYDTSGTYVNTYNLASPNLPTPNGNTWTGPGGGGTNASVDTTILRVNYAGSPATLTVSGGGNFSGNIVDGTSPIGLTVGGTSQTLTLTGNNTFSGATTIDGGDFLYTGSSTALTGATTVTANGTFDLDGSAVTINALDGTTGSVRNSLTTGGLTLNNGGSFGGTFTGGATYGWYTDLTIAGGTLNLSGNNTYGWGVEGGLTTINSGATLQAGSITGFSPKSYLTDNGTLDLNGFSNSINALTGNGAVIDSGAAATLTVTGNSSGAFHSVGSFSGSISGANTALTVAGSNTSLTLSGTNNFSGQTTITSTDTLLVNGADANSAVTVNGTLGGAGTVGAITAMTGVVSPGSPASSTGTLSASSADLNLYVNISGGSPTNDELVTSGAVSGLGTLTVDLTGLSSTGGPYTIVSAGSVSGVFTTVNVVNNSNGYQAIVAYTSTTVTVTVSSALSAPAVISPTAASVTNTTATLGGNVSSDGGAAITDRGIVYALTANNPNPIISGPNTFQVQVSGTIGIFITPVTGLTASSGYSYVAYAINSQGTTYTSAATFTTSALPTVITPIATSVTSNGATLGGNVTSDGGAGITDRGIVYALTTANPNPIISGPNTFQVHVSGTTGVFTTPITGLTASSGYSYVAYATNSDGTSYTSAATFTTAASATAPTVTAPTAASITTTGATLGGNVTSDGGAGITDRGIVYALTATDPNLIVNGTGVTQVHVNGTTGVFTTTMTGLSSSSGYSYVAYATNSQGTTYTSVGTFTTLTAAPTPAITAVSPASGPTAGGTTVTITGTNFTGATVVQFGGNNASILTVSATQITAVDPAGTDVVDVTVTTPSGGTSLLTSADQFTYVIWDQFNGNPQHTGISAVAAQPTDQVLWSTSLSNNGYFEHYGEPVFTLNNTVIVPVYNGNPWFELEAFNGATGSLKWTVQSNYQQPSYSWLPPYQPVYDPFTNRVYFAAVGGQLDYISNPDSNATPTPVAVGTYDSGIAIDTPLTVDNSGNLFFGFTGSSGGIARINAAGAEITQTGAGTPALAAAPALSNDDSMLYEAVNSYTLVELNATTLAPVNSTNYPGSYGSFITESTATPMVAPDGTVFMGVYGGDGSRGFMIHMSADLQTAYPVGAFGWDDTASVIPTSMVPSYTGTSPYLILTKYNNYADFGASVANGVNKIAVLDPFATEQDPNTDGNLQVMKEVETATSPTEDGDFIGTAGLQNATREWCTNGTAVDPATDSVFINNEDGYSYRWNLGTNTITQAVDITPGYGEPYTPTSIGPNGVVYALNGGTLFALGGYSNYTLTNVSSQNPVVVGQPVTFTTTVASTDGGAVPSGSVTYSYVSGTNTQYNTATTLGTIPLVNGQAIFTTSSLPPDHYHLIATFNGDVTDGYAAGSTVLVQAILETTTTTLSATPNPSTTGQSVTFAASVIPAGSTFVPIGTVSFMNGSTLLGTVNYNPSGTTYEQSPATVVTFTTSSLPAGVDSITAVYSGDLNFAGSTSSPWIQDVSVPTVTSPTDTNITASSATLGGDVTGDGGSPITDVGVVFALTSVNPNPTIGGTGCTPVSAGAVYGVFTTSVTDLTDLSGYSFAAYATNANGTTYSSVATFTTLAGPPPSVSSVVINQDLAALYNASGQPSPGTQRSMVNDIVYTFSEPVNISAPGVDPNVFTIAVASGWTGTVPTLNWAPVSGSGNTEWDVTFSGAGVSGNSIGNGAYDITVNHPSAITAISDSQALALTTGVNGATQAFYRLFGDLNGDEVVNNADNVRFKQALATYNAAFDFNQDGAVNNADNIRFKQSLSIAFTGFSPTI